MFLPTVSANEKNKWWSEEPDKFIINFEEKKIFLKP